MKNTENVVFCFPRIISGLSNIVSGLPITESLAEISAARNESLSRNLQAAAAFPEMKLS